MKKSKLISAVWVIAISAALTPITLLIGPTVEAGASVPTAWSIVSSPNATTGGGAFRDISCTSPSNCFAVGNYINTGGISQTLIEHWDGTAWALVSSPNTSSTEVNQLERLACTSSSACTAVGDFVNGSGYGQNLIESWDGTNWSIVTSPDTSSTETNGLGGVSCTSSSDCTAVGTYTPSGSAVYYQTLVEHWDGTSWSIIASPDTSSTDQDGLGDVSCTSSSSCIAVGSYSSGSNSPQTLVEAWNGASWSIVTSANTSTTQINGLSGISCVSSSDCTAVGSANSLTLVETWNGTTWSIVSSPNVGTSTNLLSSVSCTSAINCTAVGEHDPALVPFVPLVEDWNGVAWSIVSTPAMSSNSDLGGVSCTSATECMAAGLGAGGTLIEAPDSDAIAQGTAVGSSLVSIHRPSCVHGKYPVDCASGDFWHTFTDALIPGPGANLDLTRTYNSLNASTEGIFGYGWSSSYDVNLVVNSDSSVTFTDDDGSQVTAEPDGSGGFTLPTWADSSLTYSSGTYTFVQHQADTYTFNSSGQLTSITDANGDTTTLSYSSGKLHTVTDPGSRTLTFAYGSNGLVSSVTDPMSRVTTYAYNSSDELTGVTDPLSRVTSFTYDTGGAHLLLTMTMPNGQSGGPDAGADVVNTYDSSGRVTTQTDPNGQETTYAYSGDNFSVTGGTTTITDPQGNVEVQNYVGGEMMSITRAYGTFLAATTSYSYGPDTLGTTSATDPNGNTTSATFDSEGNQLTLTDALGNASSFSYNSFNEKTCTATPLAASPCSALSPPSAITGGGTITPPSSAPPKYVTYTEYDTHGNKIWTTTGVYAPGSGSASYSQTGYELYNGESVIIGSNTDSCTTSAPSTSLPCATISPDGGVTQLTYDSQGDLTSSSTPDGNSGGEVAKTTYAHDTDGEETSSVAPNGNLSGANAGNFTTSKTYNADGELASVTVGGGSGSTVVPRKTVYTYDGDGNRTSTSQTSSVRLIGSSSGQNSSTSLSLTLPTAWRPADQAVLSTTTESSSATPPMMEHYTANDVYLIAGAAGGGGNGPSGTQADESGLYHASGDAVDSLGDVYVVSPNSNDVEEIAATSHTQWGQSMTADDAYIIAGSSSGTSGYSGDGGSASSALLLNPLSLAVDAGGDLYIVDNGNNRIQEMAASSGTQWGQSMTANDIYTVAGSATGSLGSSGNGGAASSALLNQASGVSFDASGNLYIADSGNNAIREVAVATGSQWGQSMTANDIYTVAGGSYGVSGDGGAATSADLIGPAAVAIDAGGDILIADDGNNRVQEVPASSGTHWGQSMTAEDMYTIAGNSSGTSGATGNGGAATSATLNQPDGLVLDSAGDVYIADRNNNRIQEVPVSSGTQWGQSMTANDMYTMAGSSAGTSGSTGNGGVATSAKFWVPIGLAMDASGDLYIADCANGTLRMVAAANESAYPGGANSIYMVAGNAANSSTTGGDGGPAIAAAGLTPSGELVDSSGDLYIADGGHNRIQEVPATSGTYWGQSMLAGYTYTIAGSSSGSSGHTGNGGVATSAKLSDPVAVALDSSGDLYIADQTNNRIQEVAASSGTQWGQSMTAGDVYTIAGSSTGSSGSSGDGGAATSAKLHTPSGLAFDSSGDLYIGDSNNNRIQEVAASTGSDWGQSMTADDIYTMAGGASGASGNGGPATSADLSEPAGVAFDPVGNLYIADQNNNRIQEVAASTGSDWGQSMTADDIYTMAGSAAGTSGGSGIGGAATSALFASTPSVAFDQAGDLYLTDEDNNLVDEVPAASGTQWSQSMTADDIYTVAGGGSDNDGASGTSIGLYFPQGIATDTAGNVFIADLNHRVRELVAPVSAPQTVTTPSGWTLQSTKTSGGTTTNVYTRTLASGDTGVTLAYGLSAPKVASVAVFRGVDSTSPIDVSAVGSTSSGTGVAAPSMTTTDPGDELVFVGGASGQGASPTWTAPTGMSSLTGTNTSGVSDVVADGPGPVPSGATGSTSASTSSSGSLTAIELALAPDSVTTTTTYDADDQPTLVTDADGNASLTCYDGNGNVAETVPATGVAANSLTPASCPTNYPTDYGDRLATDGTTNAYDGLGDKTTVTTPAPTGLSGYETTNYAFDPASRLTSVAAPPTSTSGGAPDDVTAYTYDAAGELLTTTTGYGTGTAAIASNCYDPDGNKTATVAPDGNTSSVAACSSSSPYGTTSSHQTAYSYDSTGELVSETRPATTWASGGQTTTNSYDADGNQLTSEDPNGVTTTSTYSPLDQLSGLSYSGSAAPTVSYTYDADGNRIQMTDGTGTSSHTYDVFGELSSSENGASKTVDYAHDSLGNLTKVTYPLGGGATWASTDTVVYGYDASSQMTSVTDFNGNTVSISNTADGLPSSLSLAGTGDMVSTTYDSTDAPSDITLANSTTTLLGFSYSDEPSGTVGAETDTPSSSTSPSDYTYDAQSRVTQMTPGSGSPLSYGEDASSNLTTLPNGSTGSYDNASELTSSNHSGTTTNYTYDADGNRTQASVGGTTTVSASYNGASELSSYSNSTADMTAATYDSDGVRASATSTPAGGGSFSQHFVWNEEATSPELLMDATNAYLYGPGSTPVEQVSLSTGTVKYLVSDALGSVRGVVSSSGGLTGSTTYDAWGNPETTGGLTSNTPIGFAGGYTDPSGLVYLVHRYYDPSTGQFLKEDPLVDQTGQPFSYSGDDPVNASDPSGLIPSDPACAGSGPIGYSPGQLAQLCAAQQANSRQVTSEECSNDPTACRNGQQIYKLCVSVLFFFDGCVASAGGNLYVEPGYGFSPAPFGISGSLGTTTSGSACELESRWSTSAGWEFGPNLAIGGGWSANRDAEGPYASVGTPGGGVFKTYGFKVAGTNRCC